MSFIFRPMPAARSKSILSFIARYHAPLALLIAVMSAFAAIGFNEANLRALQQVEREQHIAKTDPTYHWVSTPDDAAYLRPAENFYHGGEWHDNNPGKQSYFVRTPGYGLFRYALMLLLGYEGGQLYFRYIQVLLFALSVFLLYRVAILCGLPPGWAIVTEAVYGLTPFAIGFLYYSLTEGITPALLTGYAFLLLLAYRRRGLIFYLMAAVLMGYIGLMRPVLLIFAAALPLMIWWSSGHLSWLRRAAFMAINILIVALPLTMWAYRSSEIAGKYVGIYPIYYPENNSQFRPAHQAIWRFASSFGMEGRTFHESMVPLWQATIHGDTAMAHIDSILMTIPDFVQQDIGKEQLKAAYVKYRWSIAEQRRLYPKDVAMPDTIPAAEQEVIKDFDRFTAQIKSSHPLWYHAGVPLKVFRLAAFHSNLSLWVFQHTWRGAWWMEAIRALFLLLHIACCLSFIYQIAYGRDRVVRLLMGWLIGAYFFYLCYVFRGLEERYTLPLLPLMWIGLVVVAYGLYERSKMTFNKKEPGTR